MTAQQIQTYEISKTALLNDDFRQSGFGVVLTNGVQSVPDLNGLMKAVRSFDNFNEDNDPYGERDFGSLNWYGHKIFWKIDYYNQELDSWEDPLSPDCNRVMTVMLAEDY